MAVTLTTKARNAAADAVVDLIDEGSGAGHIAFTLSNGTTVLCTCTMSDPAFGAASTGVATASAIAQGTVSGSSNPSTIALALFRDSDSEEMFRCAVGTSGSDINLSAVAVNNGDTIDITSLTYTQPAS